MGYKKIKDTILGGGTDLKSIADKILFQSVDQETGKKHIIVIMMAKWKDDGNVFVFVDYHLLSFSLISE